MNNYNLINNKVGWVSDLLVRVRGDKSQLDSTLAGAKSSITGFESVIRKLGTALGIAFSVKAIVNFTKESMKLAAEAEGVQNAFAKISGVTPLLEKLKTVTRGVVTDTDLQKLILQANSYRVSLKDLPTYLEFATNKAIELKKPIAEMAELMITGLGRGSMAARSLIQLGISVEDFKASTKTAGGTLALFKTKLAEMGVVSDTAGIRFAALTANVTNLKEAWGKFINDNKDIQKVITGMTSSLTALTDKRLDWFGKLVLALSPNKYKEFVEDQRKSNEALEIAGVKTKDLLPPLKERAKTEEEIAAALKAQKEANLLDSGKHKEGALRTFTGKERGPAELSGFLPITNATLAPMITESSDELARVAKARQKNLEDLTTQIDYQREAVDLLAGAFEDLFSSTKGGFDKMINGIIQALERLVAEVLAKKVVSGLMDLLGSLGGGWGNLFKGVGGVSNAAKHATDIVPAVERLAMGNSGTLKIDMVLKGHDIHAANLRYGNMLNRNT